MLAGALLLIGPPAAVTSPVAILPVAEAPGCPEPRIAFAPPLDLPLLLTRRIERELADGTFAQTVRYEVSFARSGRGYRMRWHQIDQKSEGPPGLLRLLALQDDSAEGEVLDFTLDSSGAVLGVSESPDSPARLARAIDRLRRDPALLSRPERERTRLSEMLDRLATLPASERAQVQTAKASRLLMLAGRACCDGEVLSADGSIARITAISQVRLDLAGSSGATRPDGTHVTTTSQTVLTRSTGLVERHQRRTTSSVAGTMRTSSESYVLEDQTNDPPLAW